MKLKFECVKDEFRNLRVAVVNELARISEDNFREREYPQNENEVSFRVIFQYLRFQRFRSGGSWPRAESAVKNCLINIAILFQYA